MRSADEIRQQFIDFFVQKHGHTAVPSSPVVPHDDPTLLFTNAGMNQFKDVFLGTGTRPYKRAVDTQKCIRAGGKHNDLDDVGKDTYHHTFFEMLGNWSFGDYFKKEAIRWAWELLTEVWGMDKSRLHATVFEGDAEQGLAADDEAAALWRSETDIDPTHIHKGNKKDNFWEMGDTGPCGPCTEIHIDRTPDKSGGKLVNKGTPDVIEIWNLVFIQLNRGIDRKLTPLPAKHVDTGMGFERVTAVLQGKTSNYDTDVFKPLMDAISFYANGARYSGNLNNPIDVAFRVIADHSRMLTFSITDGVLPSNKGRGAVIRSVLRRAFRFGYQTFDKREPFIHRLVPVIVDHMGDAFPELKINPVRVAEIIHSEEADFLRTIARGLQNFELALVDAILGEPELRRENLSGRCKKISLHLEFGVKGNLESSTGVDYEDMNGQTRSLRPPFTPAVFRSFVREAFVLPPVVPAKQVFDLHTTDGFPPDLTRQMAEERGLLVDMDGYEKLMREHEEKSRGKRGPAQVALNISGGLPVTDDQSKWSRPECEATVLGWIADNEFHIKQTRKDEKSTGIASLAARASGALPENMEVGLVLDRTCFYAEQGGQVGDRGTISTPTGRFEVSHTLKVGNATVHLGQITEGRVAVGQTADLQVSPEREFTRKNHTATHLLNWALRKVLGGTIDQKGSLVDADKTRFDFTHDKPLSAAEIAEVERLVNEKVYSDLSVTPKVMPLAEAKKIPGVRAVFGEKYPDPVRVLLIGTERPEDATEEMSVEFCGGTHLTHTGQAGFFKIISQEGVAKGVRRITAVTGRKAVETVQQQTALLDDLGGLLHCKPEEIPNRVQALQDELKKLQTQLKKGTAGDLAGAADKLLASATEANGGKIIVGEMPSGPAEQMGQQVDRLRQKAGSAVVVIGWTDEGKVNLIAAATEDLVKKGADAGKLVGEAAKVVGGKGGGRKDMARAGGKDAAKLGEALQAARKLAAEQLGA